MNAYMVQRDGECEVVLGESMADAVKRYIRRAKAENRDDHKFKLNEEEIQSCALLGEVYNWTQF